MAPGLPPCTLHGLQPRASTSDPGGVCGWCGGREGRGGQSVDHLSVCPRAALTLAAHVSFRPRGEVFGPGELAPQSCRHSRKISNLLNLSQNDTALNSNSHTSNIRLYAGDRMCCRKSMRPSHYMSLYDGSHRPPRLCLASHRLCFGCHQFVSDPRAQAVVFRLGEMVGREGGREAVARRGAARALRVASLASRRRLATTAPLASSGR